jgi:prolyl oligopeptidase PreP (S9A serine peptidase family)
MFPHCENDHFALALQSALRERILLRKTDRNRLVLRINMGAGHGGASGRYDYLREVAFKYAFLLDVVGGAGKREAWT